jgi:hypothetical protein
MDFHAYRRRKVFIFSDRQIGSPVSMVLPSEYYAIERRFLGESDLTFQKISLGPDFQMDTFQAKLNG